MSKQFEDAASALDFLVSESKEGENLQNEEMTVARQARETLRYKGAFILGIGGMYGGRDGVLGSSNPGVRIIQGTQPVPVGDVYVALRDPREERARGILIVSTGSDSPDYLKANPTPLVTLGGEGPIQVQGVEQVERRHVEAARLVLSLIDESLDYVVSLERRPLHLPTTAFVGSMPENQVLDIRQDDRRIPMTLYL